MRRYPVRYLLPLSMAVALTASCGDDVSAPLHEIKRSDPVAMDSMATVPQSRGFAGAPSKALASDRPSSAPVAPSASVAQLAMPTMLIRNGAVTMEVDSLELAIQSVRQLAITLGGYVGNTTLTAGAYAVRSANIELKIPATLYDSALSGLRPFGKVEAINSTTEDVGEEFVDVTARQANAHRLEERLVALLATRTGKLDDVLAVERELARIREEIERYEGRLRYIKARVATSTLVVTVHEQQPIVGNNPGQSIIGNAFKDAWRNFVALVAACIASLGVVAPVAVLLSVAVAAWRRRKRVRPT